MNDDILNQKIKIQSILNVFETGSIEGNYSKVSIFRDGPHRMRQITYGRSQTTEWGHLSDLIEAYTRTNGKYVEFFREYANKVGKVSLVDDKAFISALKLAGKEPIMHQTQNVFFDAHYWAPAMEFVDVNQFEMPLAALVIYDSYVHSGHILQFLRSRFEEVVPRKGGDERNWIRQYLNVRHEWLKTHSNKILNKTIYRTRDMLRAVTADDWGLKLPFSANKIIVP